ncbi:hypothetical protein CPB83DRAFT_862811 [Crepidotus variabilis]|uniref:Lysine-specific metallo-endopeptidase domain-containing protein n=1 Tax=Crepidotus variabilis TaxID=179855 RepID=A0A9P6E6M6_9AGAR|nr:hypothetical protein CPB83DRAFT_862811 [Crepidotus variabilis]
MRFVSAILSWFLTFLAVGAIPIPVNPSNHVNIHNEQEHLKTPGGQKRVDNVKQAAVNAHTGMEQSARVANFPENPENHAILVEVFKKDFMTLIDTIRKNVETIRDGKLEIVDINSGDVRHAATDRKSKEVYLGPNFHSEFKSDQQRAGTLIHEASHALVGTSDYFAKSDGKPISTHEAKKLKIGSVCGGVSKDFQKLDTCQSVWNADSYKKLASLAIEQYNKHGGKPPAKGRQEPVQKNFRVSKTQKKTQKNKKRYKNL